MNKRIRKYHLYREKHHFYTNVLFTKICAKKHNCEQLTISLLNSFENDVMFNKKQYYF